MERSREFYYHKLYELAATLNSASAPDAVLAAFVEGVAKAIGAKGCSLLLLSPDRKQLLHTVSYGLSDRYARKGPMSADESISDALEGTAVAILDATADERVQYTKENREEGIASILSVPMTHRGEIIGVVRAYTADRYRFDSADMHFVWAVANLGAIALENARMYDSVQRDYEALRQDIMEWGLRVGGGSPAT
jgi:GAF domain-containing protein